MTKNQRELLESFSIGDKARILGMPSSWSSSLCGNDPMRSSHLIKYPYEFYIKDIRLVGDRNEACSFLSMTCGKWGWSLDSLVKDNLIEKIREEPRKRLKLTINK